MYVLSNCLFTERGKNTFCGNFEISHRETPNEKLLKIARNAVHDREQSKTKLAVIGGKKRDAR
jgi:hypothetical protein